jgi:uracil-DNA glycosylase family 4
VGRRFAHLGSRECWGGSQGTPRQVQQLPPSRSPVRWGVWPSHDGQVIVGEAPGEREVVEGKPFVGKAGGRLNDALSNAGVDRLAVYITNTGLCHPEGERVATTT